jgi:hypothetical protein
MNFVLCCLLLFYVYFDGTFKMHYKIPLVGSEKSVNVHYLLRNSSCYRRKQFLFLRKASSDLIRTNFFLTISSVFYYTPIKTEEKLRTLKLLAYLRIYYTGYSKRIEH